MLKVTRNRLYSEYFLFSDLLAKRMFRVYPKLVMPEVFFLSQRFVNP